MDYVFPVWLFVIGLAFGSFLNVCIYRLPRGKSLVRPPSSCTHCGSEIRYRDNIPLVSYIILKGRCRDCKNPISIRYPLVELFSGLAAVLAWWWFGTTVLGVSAVLLIYILIPVIFIDIEFQIIPNSIIIFGLGAGITLIVAELTVGGYRSWSDAVLGGIIGAGILVFSALLGRLLFHKPSMGMGDIKLAAVLGLFLGIQNIIVSIFLSFVYALVIGGGLMIVRGNRPAGVISFGPYLALGSLTGLFFGDIITYYYYVWIGIL
ncbi:prepilin peptidase [candidate division KSB1 bacterium]